MLISGGGLLNRVLRRNRFPDVHSRQHVRRLLEKERAMADRTGLPFSLVVFRIQGRRAWSRTIQRLSRAMLDRVRATDEVGWFDSRCLCAVLRATKGDGAIRFAEAVCTMLEGKVAKPAFTVYTYPDPIPAGAVAKERRGAAAAPAPVAAGAAAAAATATATATGPAPTGARR